MSPRLAAFSAAFVVSASFHCHAQNLEGFFLPPGSTPIVINTGRANLDAAALSAVKEWNAVLPGAQFVVTASTGANPLFGNGRCEIYLAPLESSTEGATLYAQAPTIKRASFYAMQSHYVAECDVQVNSQVEWNDVTFHQAVLHELGHCLGLGHPEEVNLDVDSIMRSGDDAPALALTSIDIQWIQKLYSSHIRQAALLRKLQAARRIPQLIKRRMAMALYQSQLDAIAAAIFQS